MSNKLNKSQIEKIEDFIEDNHYSFSVEHVLEEYEKYKNFDYVSHSFKKVFERFSSIFPRGDSK